jgi:hypothetical protein
LLNNRKWQARSIEFLWEICYNRYDFCASLK